MSKHVPTHTDLTNAWQEYSAIGVKAASQEIQNHIDSNRGDAFAEGCTAMFDVLERTVDGALMLPDDFVSIPNPYRKQEEA